MRSPCSVYVFIPPPPPRAPGNWKGGARRDGHYDTLPRVQIRSVTTEPLCLVSASVFICASQNKMAWKFILGVITPEWPKCLLLLSYFLFLVLYAYDAVREHSGS
jgi:hypothetical protein